MKLNILQLVIICGAMSFGLNAQQLAGSFINGSLAGSNSGVYGNKGVNSNAHPESLSEHCMWKVGDKLYVFGGEIGGTIVGSISSGSAVSLTNRLWSWEEEKGWTLLDGDLVNAAYTDPATFTNQTAVYGTKGTASSTNQPGARFGAAHATGPNGELYLYGGFGQGDDGWGVLGDLWQYYNGQWTWLAGSKLVNPSAVHGTLNVAGSYPGARYAANLWVDNSGVVWIFGGGSSDYKTFYNNYADVMKYNPSTTDWTWVSGSASLDYVYNANDDVPEARRWGAGLYASDNKFYLFGGLADIPATSNRSKNDFWTFDGTSWVFLAGDKSGVNGLTSNAYARGYCSLVELNNNIYLFGGGRYSSVSKTFDISKSDIITYFNGLWYPAIPSDAPSVPVDRVNPGVYQTQVPEREFHMGFRMISDGKEAIGFGGRLDGGQNENWLLKTNGQSWAYLSGGEQTSTFREGLSNGPVKPGARGEAASAYDENNDILYLFGGNAYPETGYRGLSNGLWKLESGEWTWLSGTKTTNGVASYGAIGVSHTGNTPGARKNAVMWVDESGVLWLFGGEGLDVNGNSGALNDLWKYQNGLWTWVRGSNLRNQSATTTGVSSDLTPAGLYSSVVWKDANGHAYLFGGVAKVAGIGSRQNSFWKWDGSNWQYLSSAYSSNLGVYGSLGQAASSNYPGARSAMAVSGDDNGFYIYGGQGSASNGAFGYLNQLWYYDFVTGFWTWVFGKDNGVNVAAVFGAATNNNASVNPGNLRNAGMWVNEGELFLFGGFINNANSTAAFLSNNLWHWNGSEWAWLKGGQANAETSFTAILDSEKSISFKSLPSARALFVNWSVDGVHYLWGGLGLNSSQQTNMSLNDLWYFTQGNVWDGSSWSTTRSPFNQVEAVQILNSNAVSLSNGSLFGDVLVDADNTFNLNGLGVFLTGDVYAYGKIENPGNISFNGERSQTLYGRELSTAGLVTISEGTSLNTSDSLRIVANSASDYGQIYNAGTVTGEVEFEYYLDLSPGANNGRYFHLGSVLDGVQVGDFANGGIITTGSSNASQNSVWTWNPSGAYWRSPSNSSSVMEPGLGYAFYAGHNAYGDFLLTDGQTPGVVSVRGAVRSNWFPQLFLDYNDGQSAGVSFVGSGSRAETEGWNLICNPFPYNINLKRALRANQDVASSLYFWNGANGYATVVGNVSVNGGDSILAPGQGVFIQIPNGVTTYEYSLFLDEDLVREPNSPALRYKSRRTSNGIYASIEAANGFKDQIWFGFNAKASQGFDKDLDAWNMKGSSQNPDLYLPTSKGRQLAISSLNPDSTTQVPLGLSASQNHGHTLSLSFDTENLRGFDQVVLEDRKLDHFQDLSASLSYAFIHDSLYPDRFVVHFVKSGSLDISERKMDSYYFYQSGSSVYLTSFKPTAASVVVYSLGGELVEQVNFDQSQVVEILQQKPKGVYLVQIREESGKFYSLKVLKT